MRTQAAGGAARAGRLIAAAGLLLLAAAKPAASARAQEREGVTVTNVAVPVRVFHEGRFVEGLKASDFEIYEGGRPQKIVGFYPVMGGALEGRDAVGANPPDLSRHLYILFQAQDYHSKFAELAAYVFQEVFRPGDTLTIQTPIRTYVLARRATNIKSREVLIEELIRLIREDIVAGSSDYQNQLVEIKRLVGSIARVYPMMDPGRDSQSRITEELDYLLPSYREAIERMEASRVMDSRRFLRFASQVRDIKGRKSVFLVYQREFRPELQQSVVNRLMSDYQAFPDLLADLLEVFQIQRREVQFDIEPVLQAFSDAQVDFHFIYMHKEVEYVPGIDMREISQEYFRAFSRLAETTGGTTNTSQNPAVGFQKVAAESDNYYLLYFEPDDLRRDGAYRRIAVRVKNPAYRVVGRAGYFAR